MGRQDGAVVGRREGHVGADPLRQSRYHELLLNQKPPEPGPELQIMNRHSFNTVRQKARLILVQAEVEVDGRVVRHQRHHVPQIGYAAAAFGMEAVDQNPQT